MTIFNKLSTSKHCYLMTITAFIVFLVFSSSVIRGISSGIDLAEKSSAEINYFVSRNTTNLEKQKIINQKDNFYNEHIKISYPNSKKIEISYNNKNEKTVDFKLPARILYRLDNVSKIKNISLDGETINTNIFFLNDIQIEKMQQKIIDIDEKQENHNLIIELK